MNSTWTLHVEDFARIKDADIKISPLMCFIGDNNSGKSYLMSLLWGIMTNGNMFFRQDPIETPTYLECTQWFLNHANSETVVDEAAEQIYLKWFNELLESRKHELLRRIFNSDLISSGKIEIRDFHRVTRLPVTIVNVGDKPTLKLSHTHEEDLFSGEQVGSIGVEIPLDCTKSKIGLWQANFYICWNLLMMDWVTVSTTNAPPIYLPPSRTGFILARRNIFNSSIRYTYGLPNDEIEFQDKLTAPCIQFLQMLNELSDTLANPPEKTASVRRILNEEIMHGTINVTKSNGRQDILYQASDMVSHALPLMLSSAVVTEVASLILLLTTKIPLRLIIIEEPEAHLHPALQKKMAQALICFVHCGIPVWLTTHSDTILQHFNNMIKLSNRSKEERAALLEQFHYTNDDLLNKDEITLYQFTRTEMHTIIEERKPSKYGFVVPSFNSAIEDIVNEVFAFQGDD